MPIIDLSFSVSAEHLQRALPALKDHFAMPDSATNAQVSAELKQRIKAHVVGIVKEYERRAAEKTAGDAVSDIALD